MESENFLVLRRACDWLADGRAVALVTVAGTWGSSPRPAGALLAITDDGRLAGSVSGGCVEADLMERWQQQANNWLHPQVVTYGAAADQARPLALPCGATLTLVIEPRPDPFVLQSLITRIGQRATVAREVDLANGRATLRAADPGEETRREGNRLVAIQGPRWRLLVIGATDTARYLADMAPAFDYEVSVCEPRAEYRTSWDGAKTTITPGMPDDAVRALAPDARTAVIALAHDPRLDDLALLEALTSSAFYVGALGSARTNAKRRTRLRSLGLNEQALARLRGPVGLPIGSRTPPEIALAILAELTALRRGAPVARP